MRRIDNGDHAPVGQHLTVGFLGAFVQGQTQFGLGRQVKIVQQFHAGGGGLEIREFGHSAQDSGRIGKPHVFQIKKHIEMIGVATFHAVHIPDPFAHILIQMGEIGARPYPASCATSAAVL